MDIAPFELERYFAAHEFTARHLLSCSDCEALTLNELLGLADAPSRRLWEELKLSYTESRGHPLLRAEIAGCYEGIDADDVLAVVPEEGIFLLMHALLGPDDHVVCTFPAYQSLHEVARSIGCEVSVWEPDEERGWCFDLEDLQRLLRDNTRLVVVNFPHNPTGFVPCPDDFTSLVEMVAAAGAYLLSDEMYRFLEIEPGSTLPSGCELYERAVSLFGLSKSFGLPGLRVGWVVSRDRQVIDRMATLKDYTTICGSAPSEILAIMALRNRDTIVADQLARVRRNIAVLDRFFDGHGERLHWNRPAGGSVCLARLLVEDSATAFCNELLQRTGVLLAPSKLFGWGDHHVRIGFGREDLPEVINRFSGYLADR